MMKFWFFTRSEALLGIASCRSSASSPHPKQSFGGRCSQAELRSKFEFGLLIVCSALLLSTNTLFAADPPNVVIIYADDLGYADIGPFGGQNPTPHLDRMAKEGRKLTSFYVAQAVC